jgi:leucyl aminopeptidase
LEKIVGIFMLVTRQSLEPSAPIAHIVLLDERQCLGWLEQQSSRVRSWVQLHGFCGERNKLLLISSEQGALESVVLGLGGQEAKSAISLWDAAGLVDRLPQGNYQLVTELSGQALQQFVLGWEYGHYRFDQYKQKPEQKVRRLVIDNSVDITTAQWIQDACSLARDLINTPANELTPQDLAQRGIEIAKSNGASVQRYSGDELLKAGFPTVHAVGRAATAPPELIDFSWGNTSHPKVTLVGKGVCFDSGGLDIKPASGMALMKKDMGGAACVLALAQLIMQAKLPVRLRVIIPAVENAIAGNAFRPGDVIKTRTGLTVEVGNTDAEGRLILCDALALADADAPDVLIDMATLTGAARVALGPELPALFTKDAQLAAELMSVGAREADPVWHLPLWSGYDDELSSKIADLNNVSATGFSGAIIGGLFLQRFVSKAKQWVHPVSYTHLTLPTSP